VGAARHVVTGQADHPLDVEGLVAVQPQAGQHAVEDPGHWVTGRWRSVGAPRVLPAEHDHIAAGDAAEVIDDLVHQHPVADLEGVLNGRGGNRVPLDDERLTSRVRMAAATTMVRSSRPKLFFFFLAAGALVSASGAPESAAGSSEV